MLRTKMFKNAHKGYIIVPKIIPHSRSLSEISILNSGVSGQGHSSIGGSHSPNFSVQLADSPHLVGHAPHVEQFRPFLSSSSQSGQSQAPSSSTSPESHQPLLHSKALSHSSMGRTKSQCLCVPFTSLIFGQEMLSPHF